MCELFVKVTLLWNEHLPLYKKEYNSTQTMDHSDWFKSCNLNQQWSILIGPHHGTSIKQWSILIGPQHGTLIKQWSIMNGPSYATYE